jgi:ABC-type transporter Mla subunit MlaD
MLARFDLGTLEGWLALGLAVVLALGSAMAWSHRRAYQRGRHRQQVDSTAQALAMLRAEMADGFANTRAEFHRALGEARTDLKADIDAAHERLDRHLDREKSDARQG